MGEVDANDEDVAEEGEACVCRRRLDVASGSGVCAAGWGFGE